MSNNKIPMNVQEGFDFYKEQVLHSKGLINSSIKLLGNKQLDKVPYINVVAAATLLKCAIDTLAYSTFSAEMKKYANKIQEEKFPSIDLILKIETINADWLPESLETNNETFVSKEEIKEYYKFLTTFYKKSKEVSIDKLKWSDKDETSSIINKFILIIKNVSNLLNSHKVNLYDIEYSYIINIKNDVIIGSIELKK